MKIGDTLKDKTTGEARFKIADLLAEGRSYFVAVGQDTHLDDMRVILKAPRYGDENPSPEERAQRHEALQIELQALTLTSPLLPEPIDWLTVDFDGEDEPVLVQEFISGKTLRAEVERETQGMDPARALSIIRELAIALHSMHKEGYAFRDLNPDHVMIGFDDIIHLTGTGNMIRMGDRPVRAKKGVSKTYSAPEIRSELSGKFITPKSDIYSLGALLSFLLSGEDPTEQVEGPLSKTAHGRLLALPEGYRLLVARCIQPMSKHRFKNIQAMLPHLTPSTLPTRQDKGFDKVELPMPFDRNLDTRASRSRLSAGPLISTPRDPEPKKEEPAEIVKAEESLPAPWYKSCLPWASMIVLTLGATLWAAL